MPPTGGLDFAWIRRRGVLIFSSIFHLFKTLVTFAPGLVSLIAKVSTNKVESIEPSVVLSICNVKSDDDRKQIGVFAWSCKNAWHLLMHALSIIGKQLLLAVCSSFSVWIVNDKEISSIYCLMIAMSICVPVTLIRLISACRWFSYDEDFVLCSEKSW